MDADLLMARLSGSDFSGADLSGADLEAAEFQGANLAGARLAETNLTDTDFTDCNWWRALGLSAETLERLRKEFPPGANTKAGLKRDFENWLKGADLR